MTNFQMLMKYGSVTVENILAYNALYDEAAEKGHQISEGHKTEYGYFVRLIGFKRNRKKRL